MKSAYRLLVIILGLFIHSISSGANCPPPKPKMACASAVCTADSSDWEWVPFKAGTGCRDVVGNASSCDGSRSTCPLACPHPSEKSRSTINEFSPQFEHPYRHGAVPTISAQRRIKAKPRLPTLGAPACEKILSYGSGIDANEVTSGPPRVYLVVYGSQWGAASTDPSGDMAFSADKMGELPRLQSFFKGLGTGGELWSGTMTQYCDGPGISFGDTACPDNASHVGYPASVVLAGIWYDNSAGSPRISTGHQLAAEAVSAAKFFGNTTPESNRYAQYVILSPPGTNPDGWNSGSGFCAWHDYNGDKELDGGAAPSDFGDIAFTNMPYVSDAGLECGANFVNSGPSGMIDGVTIVEGHEYAETITDQKPLGGWANRTGYAAYVGGENADVCAWTKSGQGAAANVTMGNGSYALQSTWSNDTARCDISHTVWHKLPTPTPTPTCVDVPDVTDSFADNAVNILTAASFIVVKQSRPGTTTNLHDAVVYRESPASGKCIKKGSKVTISIENGPVP